MSVWFYISMYLILIIVCIVIAMELGYNYKSRKKVDHIAGFIQMLFMPITLAILVIGDIKRTKRYKDVK